LAKAEKEKTMAVKLRLMRMGRRHRPFFRLNAIESRNPRDGAILEKLGHYDPIEKDPAKQLVLNKERIEYWLGVGAVPSDTVAELIAKIGIVSKNYQESLARKKRARVVARKKGILYDNTQRTQAKKIAEKAEADAAEAAAKTKAEADAAAKTDAAGEAKPEPDAEKSA
jgi:small subunit ribosomal protein S16